MRWTLVCAALALAGCAGPGPAGTGSPESPAASRGGAGARVPGEAEGEATEGKRRPGSPGKSATVSLDVEEEDLQAVLNLIGQRAGVNIIADPDVKETVTVSFRDLEWESALEIVARQARCGIVQESDRLIRLTQPPSITMEFQDADIRVVLELLARQAGVNIVIPGDVRGRVTVSLRDVPWREALDTVARAGGYVIVRHETGRSDLFRVREP